MSEDEPVDPRLGTDYVESFSGTGETGDATLVGVVHDHPASLHRVRTTVEKASPRVLCLELPSLAIPLYEAYADDDREPPVFGGEMSAAIQAASTDDVAGIDGPSAGFLRYLATALYRERASAGTVVTTVRSLLSVTRTAVECRIAGSIAERTSLRIEVDPPTDHDVSSSDTPERQSEDERQQVRVANSVLRAFETTPSSRCRSESRERYMAERIAAARERGDVVAVVGIGHLDPLSQRIERNDA